MSSGHSGGHSKPANADALLRRYLADPRVKKRLEAVEAGKVPVDEGHDLPFLSGTTGPGTQWGLAFDRHLPKTISLGGKQVDPRLFLRWHEALERALMDILAMVYGRAHVFAEMYEHQKVREAGFDPAEYEKALKPYIKAVEMERLETLPPKLDKRPYQQDHDQSDNAKAIRRKLVIAA